MNTETKSIREIKFRAWDYQNNRWASQNDVAGSVGLLFGIKDYFINIAGEKAVRFSFQQYTGLKDKSGTEIYEGDIVKKLYGATIPMFEVGWDALRCMFIQRDGYNEPLYQLPIEYLEVVGNIHEHPRLLTPTTELNEKR